MNDRLSRIEELTDKLNKSEQALQESTERYKALADATFEAIFICVDDICIDANKSACEMFQYAACDLIGKSIYSFFNPNSAELLAYNMSNTKGLVTELVAKKSNGVDFFVEVRSRTQMFMGSLVVTLVIRDITDRRLAQKGMIKLLELWESTFNALTDIISLHNLDGTIIEINEAFRQKFGTSGIGKKCYEVIHESKDFIDNCPYGGCINKFSLDGSSRYDAVTSEIQQADGTWYEVSCSPLVSDGSLTGIVHVLKDITTHKNHELEILKNNQLYKNLLEMSSVAILVYEHGKVVDCNSALLQLLEKTSTGDVIGKDLCNLGLQEEDIHEICLSGEVGEKRKFMISLDTPGRGKAFVSIRVRKFVYGSKHGSLAVTIDPVEVTEKRRKDD